MQDLNNNQLKVEVHDSHKKHEKISSNFDLTEKTCYRQSLSSWKFFKK